MKKAQSARVLGIDDGLFKVPEDFDADTNLIDIFGSRDVFPKTPHEDEDEY